MKIIAHRGAWSGDSLLGVLPCKKNSDLAFRIAGDYGFGIETDFREICGKVVISHNPPAQDALTAADFFKMLKSGQIIAVNVKADGLSDILFKLWKENAPDSIPFAFDMSVPDTLGYVKVGFPFFERRSEYEKENVWDEAKGFWLDGFHSVWFDQQDILSLLANKKPVCIVSPELHGREYLPLWVALKSIETEYDEYQHLLWLCTDKPFEADRFFNRKD